MTDGFWLDGMRIDALFPTASASDHKGSSKPGQRHGMLSEAAAVGAILNPDWVEKLMGFPEGWTDLSETTPTEE